MAGLVPWAPQQQRQNLVRNWELGMDMGIEVDADVDAGIEDATEIKTETEADMETKTEAEIELNLGLEVLDAADDSTSIKYMQEIEEEELDAPEEEKESADLKEKIIVVKGTKYVADTFHGVRALYRAGGNDGTNATYSCAAFVKRYYSQVYGVTVNNLFAGCTPVSSKGTIRKVSSPKEGDIVATSSGSGNHWAIVKNVNSNGTITLIEQNWKWQQGGKTMAKVNRRVKASACKIYRLKK